MHFTQNILQTKKQMSLMRESNNQFMRICLVRKIDVIADNEASHCKFFMTQILKNS